VQSTKTGTAYLVNTAVTVSNLASITGAADSQQNSVTISSAATNTNLAATGLVDGTYKVYAVDAAGNLSSASTNSVTLDTTAPTASVTTATITNSGNAVVRSTETGTAYLVNTAVSVSNLASITGAADNQQNSVAISSANTNTNLAATGLVDGTYKVYAVDAAGNLSSASTNSVTLDTTAPTISSVTAGWGTSLNATEDNSAGTVTVVTSGAENGQTVTVSLNGTNYTGTVSDNSTSVTVAAAGLQALTDGSSYTLTTNVSDAAGNAATENTGTSFTYDKTAPTISGGVAISSASGVQNSLLNAGDNVSVTATFSESVIVDNSSGTPTLTLVVGSDNRTSTYTSGSGSTPLVFQYTIQAGDNDTNGISIGANTLALNSGTIRDAAGNNATITYSSVSANTSYKVDNTAPSVDNFTLSDTALKAGDNATVTLVFSEAVASFSSSADITVANGTLAVMTSTDNITWAGTFTPTANTEDDNNTLSLATSYTDTVGNTGTAAESENFEVETRAPTVSSFTLSDTALKAGDNATVTLVFSEAVASFSSASDITVANGTLAAMSSADNITWAGTFTPTANTEDDNNTLSLATSYTDTAGNAGPAETTLNYVVDTTAPTVSSISTTADNQSLVSITDNITVTFSKAIEPSYVTTSTSDTNCAGSIRVSSDNFSTCVRMSSEPVSSNSNRTFTLDPVDNLTIGSTYITRVTTGVKDTAGNAMSSQYDNSTGFTTTSSSTQMGGSIQGTELDLSTAVTTLAGSSSGSTDATGTSASFNNPYGITTDGTNLYVADSGNHRIRQIVISTGVVTTLAGSSSGYTDATGTSARFNYPRGITTDGTNLYVADYGKHRIRKIE